MLGPFGMPKLPSPPPEVLEEKTPEGVTEDMALFAWREGWIDGRNGHDYRILEKNAELQDLYSDGYDTGEHEKGIISEFKATRQDEESEASEAGGEVLLKRRGVAPVPPAHLLYTRRALNYFEDNRRAFEGFCYLMVGVLAARLLMERAFGEDY